MATGIAPATRIQIECALCTARKLSPFASSKGKQALDAGVHMQYERRAQLASHAFALILAILLVGLVLPHHIENKRLAELQLHEWAPAVAVVENAEIEFRRRHRSCSYQIRYSFVAGNGNPILHHSKFPCEMEGWFDREPVPMAEKIDILYDKSDPTQSRPLVLVQEDYAFKYYYLLLVGIVLWFAFYPLARKAIRFAISLP